MKKLGFGCMRLPIKEDGTVDIEEFVKMVDLFIKEGFTYFDTAHGYIGGQSETALKAALTSRYPRDAYTITDKLTGNLFNKKEEIRGVFNKELEACGVTYFDYYLMHAQTSDSYRHFMDCEAYEEVAKIKEEGKIKHFGISFHDTPEMLEKILIEHPSIEFVQIQFNYADYNSSAVQSRKVYEMARKYGKEVLVMEPVKGGSLTHLPPKGEEILHSLGDGSEASYAIRFAASQEGVYMVLSGMSTLAQVEDNISYMKEFVPLTDKEKEGLFKVADIFNHMGLIPCTGCKYCVDGCPMKIAIPSLFSCLNSKEVFKNSNGNFYYWVHTREGGKASSCIKCGHCESVCPQHLPIRKLLEKVALTFEDKK